MMVVQDTGRGAGLLGDLDPNALNSLEEDLEGADPSEEPPMVVAQWLIFKGDCLSNLGIVTLVILRLNNEILHPRTF